MSERPPDGWDTQADSPTTVEVDDEVLAGHLRRRGAPAAPRSLTAAILARVDETAPQRRWRLTLAAWRPRMAVAVSGLTLALVAGLLYLNAMPRIGTDRATPSPSAVSMPSAVASGAIWDPAQRALRPPELLRIMATNPTPGTVLIVDDQIARLDTPCLLVGGFCPPAGTLVNAGITVSAPLGGHLPLDGQPSEISGPLALRVIAGPTLEFLGAVVSNGGRMEFHASDLVKRSAMGGLFVIPAWLWATAVTPCASVGGTPVPMPTSELGLPAPRLACFPIAWLTDTESEDPSHGGGVGLPVQNEAHEAFAPNPGINPGQGIYLVRDWAGYAEILARLEPLPIPSDEAIGPTTEPSVQPTPSAAGGIVMSSDELVARVSASEFPVGSIVVASIPVSAVKILQPYTGAKPDYPWAIVSGSRSIRVQGLIASGIVGVQSFVVESSAAVKALGQVATTSAGGALDGVNALPIPDGLSAVHGWLRVGPPLPCPAPLPATDKGILGEPLAWSECPGIWILPSDLDPWAGNDAASGRYGDRSVPAGTLHVQDGASGAAGEPLEGDWLVRVAKTNPCLLGRFCALQLDPQPPPGVTWYELVGPITAPQSVIVSPPVTTDPRVVLTQDQLVASVGSGAVPIGSIVIARATIAPVILPAFPPDPGAVAGKIGPLRVYWASDPSLSAPDLHQIALRVRPDGDVDYLGPVALGLVSAGSTNALFVVQTLRGPVLLRRIDCDTPQTPAVCPLAEGDSKTLTLGLVFVPQP